MQQPASPLPISNRIELLDVLRGFALMGMVVVHMVGYADYKSAWFGPATDFLLASKMLSLFSFLFGAGFAVQMTRAESSGRSFLPLYLRRMLMLFVFGALQSFFLGWNSIFEQYAIIGLMLLPIRRLSFRWIVVLILIVLSLGVFQRQYRFRFLGASVSRGAPRYVHVRALARVHGHIDRCSSPHMHASGVARGRE